MGIFGVNWWFLSFIFLCYVKGREDFWGIWGIWRINKLFLLASCRIIPMILSHLDRSRLSRSFLEERCRLEPHQALLQLFLGLSRQYSQFFQNQMLRKLCEFILLISFQMVLLSSCWRIRRIRVDRYRPYLFQQSYAIQLQLLLQYLKHILIIWVLHWYECTFWVNWSSTIIIEEIKGSLDIKNLFDWDKLTGKGRGIKSCQPACQLYTRFRHKIFIYWIFK